MLDLCYQNLSLIDHTLLCTTHGETLRFCQLLWFAYTVTKGSWWRVLTPFASVVVSMFKSMMCMCLAVARVGDRVLRHNAVEAASAAGLITKEKRGLLQPRLALDGLSSHTCLGRPANVFFKSGESSSPKGLGLRGHFLYQTSQVSAHQL